MSSVKFDIVVGDAEELKYAAAAEFVHQATVAVRTRGIFTVVLSGGSTPKSFYMLLASTTESFRQQVPWDKIHFFWGDERHVPPDHPDSNYRMVQERLLSQVPVPPENVHRIKSENPDAGRAASEYEQELQNFFESLGLSAPRFTRFDLVFLGMGPDGHTASLFPGNSVSKEPMRLVAAPWVEKFNTYRITLTPLALTSAACVIFLVSGAEKAETLRAVLEGDYQPDRFPAQIIRPTQEKLLWLTDQAAVSRLRQAEEIA